MRADVVHTIVLQKLSQSYQIIVETLTIDDINPTIPCDPMIYFMLKPYQ